VITRITLTVVALLTTGAVPRWAAASEDSPDHEIAERHFAAGARRYAEKDYLGAVDEFEAARRAQPLPAFDFNIGRSYDRLERVPEALAAYRRYVASSPTPADAIEVQARIQELEQRLAGLELSQRRAREVGPRTAAHVGVGVAALGLGAVAAGLLGSTAVDYAALTGSPSCNPCAPSQFRPLELRANLGYTFLAVGGALAVIDIALLAIRARRARALR
jgi:tetratricopeptide (TPR) repeat protein